MKEPIINAPANTYRIALAELLQWTIVLQALSSVLLVSGSFELASKIYRFVRRVSAKTREASPTLGSRKTLGMWTFMVLPFMLSSVPTAAAVLYVTMSIELGLLAFVMVIVFAWFLWAIWAIVPAFVERIRESLEH